MKMILIALVMLLSFASARVPIVGENVTMLIDDTVFTGTVADITDSYISIHNATHDSSKQFISFQDICIGWGQVTLLSWPT